MNPKLKLLHEAITNRLHPQNTHTPLPEEEITKLITASRSLTEQFKQDYFTITQKDTQEIYIENTQLICTELIERIHSYLSHPQFNQLSKHQKLKLEYLYHEIQNELINQIELMLDLFANHFNFNQKLPSPYHHQLKQQVEILVQNFQSGQLLKIILNPLQEHLHNNRKLNYTQYHYWQQLLKKLLALLENQNEQIESATIRLLICYNFNDRRFHRYLMDRFTQKINIEDITKQQTAVEKWSELRKKIYLLQQHPKKALNPGITGCKKTILRCIEYEIKALETGESLNRNNQTQTMDELPGTILFHLTVPQIGMLYRAMVETNIVETNREGEKKNIKELMRKLSCYLRTSSKEDLSPKKLYNAYFAFNPAAIDIVKTRLLEMVRWLQKFRPLHCMQAMFLEQLCDFVIVMQ